MNANVTSLLKKLLVLSLAAATAAPLCAMGRDSDGTGAGVTRADVGVRRRLAPVLYAAVMRGREELVREKLAAGEDVNFANQDGTTLLHVAAAYGHEKIVKVLFDYGVNATAVNKYNHTAADVARMNGYEKIATLIDDYADCAAAAAATTGDGAATAGAGGCVADDSGGV